MMENIEHDARMLLLDIRYKLLLTASRRERGTQFYSIYCQYHYILGIMSGFKDVLKEGWHPKSKDGGKEGWRADFKGIDQVVSFSHIFFLFLRLTNVGSVWMVGQRKEQRG